MNQISCSCKLGKVSTLLLSPEGRLHQSQVFLHGRILTLLYFCSWFKTATVTKKHHESNAFGGFLENIMSHSCWFPHIWFLQKFNLNPETKWGLWFSTSSVFGLSISLRVSQYFYCIKTLWLRSCPENWNLQSSCLFHGWNCLLRELA